MEPLSIALIAGSISQHLTHGHEPAGGYNETHNSLGVEIIEDTPGWHPGLIAFRFEDSYGKTSVTAMTSYAYGKQIQIKKNKITEFLGIDGLLLSPRGGVAAGYLKTSYYEGLAGFPFAEIGYKGKALQFSVVPKMKNTDAVFMMQFKVDF